MRVSVFDSAAAGDVAPNAETVLCAASWDLAYDDVNDRLFVAANSSAPLSGAESVAVLPSYINRL